MRKIIKNIISITSLFLDKYFLELLFQFIWAREFKNNKDLVLKYWKKYRYLDEINDICKIKKNMKILDIGCGISTVLHFIDGERYGIDPLADKYKYLYSYPKDINIQKGFGEDIPFKDGYFDVVFCSNVLDHVSYPKKTIDEIKRVLKKNGSFVLTVELFKEKKQRDPAHPYAFTKKDLKLLLDEEFKIIFEKESPWIGLRNYVKGNLESQNKEAIYILKKVVLLK